MKAKDVRNTIVLMLHEYTQVDVYRSGQVSPEAKIPYITYSVTSPYQPETTPGHFETVQENDETYLYRRERAGMSLSFTACSQNREKDGIRIQGEDEAMELAEKAQGWFLFVGRAELSAAEIVVEDVNNVQPRNVLMVDEEANRYGFDVLVRYIREDRRVTGNVEEVIAKGKKL